MTESLFSYFKAIKCLDTAENTEHTLRGSLENLLNAISTKENLNLRIIHEPKRDKTNLGAPDFKIKLNEAILGYLETKPISENLDTVLQSPQIAKYNRLSGNLVLTDYLEWIWLRDGEIIKRETLCYPNDAGNHRARLDPDKAEKVDKLITNFLSVPPVKLGNTNILSRALAVRCHELRDFMLAELERQENVHQEGRLYGLYEIFKTEVFQELSLKEFADAFAQTLGYGLFLAKLNAGETTAVTLANAKNYISTNFELIRELVTFLDELELEEYRGIKWLVEEILGIMNTLDLTAIHEDLVFTNFSDYPPPTEDERLLFAKDPYVYFYEDFLQAYDEETRKSRGVYYTPPPVVNFIVRAVNDILKDTFDITNSLADRKRVTVLDFSTGTGTFLLEVLQQIFEIVSQGIRTQIVKEHVLKNLYGFEYLIAPYTIAHLKLSQFLHDKGYTMQSGERLNIYLTNTLEPIEPQRNLLLPALSREVEAAQEVKEQPILVIIGNPPYNVKSRNNGEWITNLVKDDYFKIDGKELDEKNPKNLLDDYVKFIRFAQWKMGQVEEGVVGIITNHAFLNNPTFRGMRQSLMQTFNEIYLIDLHGHTQKKGSSPEGSKDGNVFDIEQGVAISLLVKKKGLQKAVYHADLWGTRNEKYRALLETKKDRVKWTELHPSTPFYPFFPQDEIYREEYELGWKVTDIFKVKSTGIKTHRDHFVTDIEENDLRKRIAKFCDLSISDEEIAKKYFLKTTKEWNLSDRRKSLSKDKDYNDAFTRLLYRPFDTIAYFNHNDAVNRPRSEVMNHMIGNQNIGLVTVRQVPAGQFNHVTCSSVPIEMKTCSHDRGTVLFPLYLYPQQNGHEKNQRRFFEETDLLQGKERIENFSPNFREFIATKYQHQYSPEEILSYIYAILHCPTYRQRYIGFLKIDFPRIPFVDTRQIFDTLSQLGLELLQAHLLETFPKFLNVDVIAGTFNVKNPRHDAQHERLYINDTQYFSSVSKDVWAFQIGGYQILDKYLKSRKCRTLSLDEIEHVQNVVNVLHFTIDQMQRIDDCLAL